MLITLSPAKSLNINAQSGQSQARGNDTTSKLVKTMTTFSTQALQDFMKISPALAEQTQTWFQNHDTLPKHRAGEMFDGDVWKHFDYTSLDTTEKTRAQNTVRILSGLYGFLRPEDNIAPYRLEMGKTVDGMKLARLWQPIVAELIEQDMAQSPGAPFVLNLASLEYSEATQKSPFPIFTAKFLEERQGSLKTVAVNAKRARGAMARWAVQSAIKTPEEAKDFSGLGYKHAPSLSSERELFFVKKES